MKVKQLNRHKQTTKGFTLVELMVATAVFSILLLLSLAGFLQIGQLFYKGVNITVTTNAGKQVINGLKTDIAFDASNSPITRYGPSNVVVGLDSIPRFWFCAGSNRYSYILGRQLDTEAQAAEMNGPTTSQYWSKFALIKERLSSPGCTNPYVATTRIIPANATEMLGDKMRLSNLTITRLSFSGDNDKLYTVTIKLAYGDDEVFQDLNNARSTDPTCKSAPAFSRYCFETDLRTTARQGIQP